MSHSDSELGLPRSNSSCLVFPVLSVFNNILMNDRFAALQDTQNLLILH